MTYISKLLPYSYARRRGFYQKLFYFIGNFVSIKQKGLKALAIFSCIKYENTNEREQAVATNDSIASTLQDRLVGLLLHTTQDEIKDFCASASDLLLFSVLHKLDVSYNLMGGCGEATLFFHSLNHP